jgi:hypothetical protein
MFSGVLNERHALRIHYDGAKDAAHVVVSNDESQKSAALEKSATLLLDAAGFLVGVDVDPDGPNRVAVMLGPHEAVSQTKAARVETIELADGELASVRIDGAKALCRAHEKNPYVG